MGFAFQSLFLFCAISGLFNSAGTLKPTSRIVNRCPSGWTQFNCNCYIYQEDGRTHADAELVCNSLGGHLVYIESDLENDFVLELMRDAGNSATAWIGLTDLAVPNTYAWTDTDITFGFNNFNTDDSEPSSDTGDCAELDESDGSWQTSACDTETPYVCIRDVFRGKH
ncbi:lithostathine-1-like [Corythoichthys intestinalis]|uniref:lithostathine-1-like n=1 Tax=Corythoichthys intestinalis TaxID=161448 RepID=UPI0025A67AF0|nr:lithostathine-1-like [Corythoichthys intestinalis]